MKKFIKKGFDKLSSNLASHGLLLSIRINNQAKKRDGKLVNIGCGDTPLLGFVNCDIESPHYHPKLSNTIIRYNMREDNLPFDDESVDAMYCAHVIEHVESNYVQRFLSEAFRVLKKNGVLRVVVPDALFLFNMFHKSPDYFQWHKFFSDDPSGSKSFVRLVGAGREDESNFGLDKNIKLYDYEELMKKFRDNQAFDSNNPQRHINNWDLKRLALCATDAGFSDIIESKKQGSIHKCLQGPDIDLTHPQISLYTDILK